MSISQRLLSFLPVVILIAGCAPIHSKSSMLMRTQVLMGTVPVTITVRNEPSSDAVQAAFDDCRRLEGLFSRWIRSSDISRINRAAWQRPVTVNADTIKLLQRSVEISELTDGSFDITYPSPAGTFRDLIIDPEARQVRFRRKDLQIDTDGIAKGFMVDRMVRVLQDFGVTAAMVNAGGDLRVIGRGPGGTWKIKIQHPDKPRGQATTTVRITDQAVASAGFYEQGPHIYDPITRQLIRWKGLSGVSVIASDAATANAVATALWVKGPEAAKLFAGRLKKIGIRTILIP